MVYDTLSVLAKQLSGKDFTGLDVLAVVLTGLSVVFAGLIILILLVMLYGKMFDHINKKKEQKAEAEKNAMLAQQALKAPPVQKAMPDIPPVIESGIEEETVAVIMAAVEAFGAASGKKLVLKGIKRASAESGRAGNAWAQAAWAELTRPF